MTVLRLEDPAATEAFGAKLAAHVKAGDVIALTGTLGAGKTSLARGLLAALGLVGEAPSPSFAIVQPYTPPEVRLPVLHIDLYRIDDPDEIVELALDDARYDSVLIVEWPERAGPDYWPDALRLDLTIEPDGTRGLTAGVPEGWTRRWPI
ncbi:MULTISPECIES: tRNA (adenosine(37)-N6)-threonylcarbamoyltransferase complex ATPase subunit type 1 TsaE [unclassified Sphingomonas]|uniref:tRNA (adenosine(37)-N6)-threonylcarbamoyltransferase complex ATPase subunit type 1 TsaE n=1 Tax=unclassified Sphingomonas TaxID=196159 RepID=UPI00070127D9|nr:MULTISPECIES: tRNA (adenosine(37)-N6)-threonylcarbamoyltransferase complex ATPase subunit type 1 TsaE [unclassified Sphingomonas]KQN20830.1 tRNA threonylcarbamoyladenosine biosynthesis protein TsaE [Sphingomonas sp. Leaf30]MBD8550311.1 tRNA (adenosine(37)-N6)-threonylcarbamoyltransferase complex ATPase subunit type 1 TsaE [Sphingomonas sp. CFBP 8764]